jgi:hypothetical protein
MRWLHNTDMNKKLTETISIAYRKFRLHHETDCAEQFDITLDEWLAYFHTTGLEVAQPKFKPNRIKRTDNTKPWSIDNLTLIIGDAHKAKVQDQIKQCRERKRAGLTKPKQSSAKRTAYPAASKQDDDGTTYEVLTVREWLDAVRATS